MALKAAFVYPLTTSSPHDDALLPSSAPVVRLFVLPVCPHGPLTVYSHPRPLYYLVFVFVLATSHLKTYNLNFWQVGSM